MNPKHILVVVTAVLVLRVIGEGPAPALGQVNWDAWKPKDTPPVEFPALLVEAAALATELRGGGGEDEIVLLDARPRADYEAGHIPGARSYVFTGIALEPIPIAVALGNLGLDGGEKVVVYGGTEEGLEIGRLFWMLEVAGHRDVRVLNGGVEAWIAAGGMLSAGPVTVAPVEFEAEPDTSRLAEYEYVLARYGRRGFTLLDWRTPGEWAEGHIPHSLPFPLEKLLDERGRLLEPREIRSIFAEWGPRPREYVNLTDEIIVCGSGPPRFLPVHPYLAARVAGIGKVRFYAHGSTDWKHRYEAPLVRMISAEGLRARLEEAWGSSDLPDLPPPDLMLFDLRGERDFVAGHIPGALWIPSYTFEADFPRAVSEYWPGADPLEVPVVVYCYGPTCTRSRNCSTMAARHGFKRLFWFKDGSAGWKTLGERLVRSTSP